MPDTGHVMGQMQKKNMKDVEAVVISVLLPRSIYSILDVLHKVISAGDGI